MSQASPKGLQERRLGCQVVGSRWQRSPNTWATAAILEDDYSPTTPFWRRCCFPDPCRERHGQRDAAAAPRAPPGAGPAGPRSLPTRAQSAPFFYVLAVVSLPRCRTTRQVRPRRRQLCRPDCLPIVRPPRSPACQTMKIKSPREGPQHPLQWMRRGHSCRTVRRRRYLRRLRPVA